jgi:hypothetical protein
LYSTNLTWSAKKLSRRTDGEEASIPLWQGGSPFSQLIKANWNQLHDQMVASDLVTDAELADDLQRIEDPAFMSFAETMWSAWGRKPKS